MTPSLLRTAARLVAGDARWLRRVLPGAGGWPPQYCRRLHGRAQWKALHGGREV